MQSGLWVVMFARSDAPTIGEVLEALDDLPGCTFSDVDPDSGFAITKDGAVLSVALNKEPYVLEEAAEFAADFAESADQRRRVASLDARFELQYELADIDPLFNALMWVSEMLMDMTDGVTFDAVNGVFTELEFVDE